MEVCVLGPLRVLRGEVDVTPKGRLQRLVLVRLLIAGGHPVDVDKLVEDVFEGEQRPLNCAAALQTHVSRLRTALVGAPGDRDLIVRSDAGYRLLLEDESVDSRRFEGLVSTPAAVVGSPTKLVDRLTAAFRLWRGPALCDFASVSFTQAEIRRLEELWLVAMEELFEARLQLGEHHTLVPELQGMADLHPLRERVWGQLMRALYLDGRQAEALRAYQRLRRRLVDELGLAPNPELHELELAILSHDPSLRAAGYPDRGAGGPTRHAFGTAPSGRRPPYSPLTHFVGRQAARAAVLALLGEHRLVTLTGMAGVGKTRLALDVVAVSQEAGPGDVVVAELASVLDPALLVEEVAAALDLPEDRRLSTLDHVAGAIGRRPMTLLLDNCEHLSAACAELAWQLLHRCPGLRIVTTSQHVLGIPGEVAWTVPPLSLPTGATVAVGDVAASEAAQLFCDRARLARPEFALDATNADAVDTICRRLDGLPLAIELAAATIGVLTVQEVAELLDDRVNLPVGGSRWVAARHQTLSSALDWSHGLLSGPEQVLLRRFSVFAGGAAMPAAEQVCAGADLPEADVFDALTGLVAKSLVVVDTRGCQARYRLLETVRCYAAERLRESGERTVVASAHARWCLELAERSEPELSGASQRAWVERLHLELDNLRVALEWAATEPQSAVLLRLAAALTPLWVRCHATEGVGWLQRALLVGADDPGPLRVDALFGLSRLWSALGDRTRAVAAGQASLELASTGGDTRGRSRALVAMGMAAAGTPDALGTLEDGVQLAREAGDAWAISSGLLNLGWNQLHRGQPAAAHAPFAEALELARVRGDEPGVIPNLIGLAYVAILRADSSRADELLGEASQLAQRLDDAIGHRMVLHLRAELEMLRGDYDEAETLLREEHSQLGDEAPSSGAMMECLHALGRLALDVGEVEEARRYLIGAQKVLHESGGRSSYVLVGLAEVELRSGNADAAHGLVARAAVEARSAANAVGRADAAHQLGELARRVGRLDQAWQHHGRALRCRVQVQHFAALPASLEAIASLLLDEHDGRRAARLLAAASDIRDQSGPVRPPSQQPRHTEELRRLEKLLVPNDLRVAWAEGEALTVLDAVQIGLEAATRASGSGSLSISTEGGGSRSGRLAVNAG